MSMIRRPHAFLLLASLLAAQPALADDPPAFEGAVQPAETATLRWAPLAWREPVRVREVQEGPKGKGEVWLRLEAPGLDLAIDNARRRVGAAEQQIAWLTEDQATLAARQALPVANAKAKLAETETAAGWWKKHGRADAVLGKDLDLKKGRDRLGDEQEELRQLEHMYREARIDNQTQSLVVNRTRRDIERMQKMLEIGERELTQWRSVELPLVDAAKDRALADARMDLVVLARDQERETRRLADQLAEQRLALAGARQSLAHLEADRAALAVPGAPGRVSSRLEVGDLVNPGQDLGRLSGDGWVMEADVPAKAALQLAPGAAFEVEVPALDLKLKGKLERVADEAKVKDGKATVAVRIRLDTPAKLYANLPARAVPLAAAPAPAPAQ